MQHTASEFDELTVAESGVTLSTQVRKTNISPEQEDEPMHAEAERQPETSKIVALPEDWEESRKIEQVLRDDYHQFESVADQNKKKQILAKLQKIIEDWIQDCGRSLGMEETAV